MDRWPAGDPPLFGDVDAHMLHYASPTKMHILTNRDDPEIGPLFDLAFNKRPAEELYDLKKDPYQLNNLVDRPEYKRKRDELRNALDALRAELGENLPLNGRLPDPIRLPKPA